MMDQGYRTCKRAVDRNIPLQLHITYFPNGFAVILQVALNLFVLIHWKQHTCSIKHINTAKQRKYPASLHKIYVG
jgi:hypothetical protein